jgi:uncharacterized repeat protein (TIGR02543 family)
MPFWDSWLTVIYNPNGGDGEEVQHYVHLHNTNPTYELRSPEQLNISRLGYTFVAWNTEADGSGTYHGLNSFRGGGGTHTLYAIWMNELNDDSIRITLNNQEVLFDVPPIIEEWRVLVPFRAIFEAAGAVVTWNADTQTVTAIIGDMEISMRANRNSIEVNGYTASRDVSPVIINDRTLVPVHAVSDILGASVSWNEENNTVIIITESLISENIE